MTDVGILAGPEGPGDRSKKWGPKIPTFWVSRVPRGRPDPQNQSFPPPGKVLFYYFRACCCAALLALLGVMAPGAHAAGGSEPRRHRRLGAGRVEAAAHRRDPARARLWPPHGCIFLEIGEPRHRNKYIHPGGRSASDQRSPFLYCIFGEVPSGAPFLYCIFGEVPSGAGLPRWMCLLRGGGSPILKEYNTEEANAFRGV